MPTSDQTVPASAGIGAAICGADGSRWGTVVGDGGNTWILSNGALVRKSLLGVQWCWARIPVALLEDVVPPKPCRRPLVPHDIEGSFGPDLPRFLKTAADTTPHHRRSGLVEIKKHSLQGCAIIAFRDHASREYVLQVGEPYRSEKFLHHIDGIPVDFKRHRAKEAQIDCPNEIFAGWGHQTEKRTPLRADAILGYVQALLMQRAALGRSTRTHSNSCQTRGAQEAARGGNTSLPNADNGAQHPLREEARRAGNHGHRGRSASRARSRGRDLSSWKTDCKETFRQRSHRFADLNRALDEWSKLAGGVGSGGAMVQAAEEKLSLLLRALTRLTDEVFSCKECAKDHAEVLTAAVALQHALSGADRTTVRFGSASPTVARLREQLLLWAAQQNIIHLPVSILRFTHDRISTSFRHGDHGGLEIESLVLALLAGEVDLHSPMLDLEVVYYHGQYRSLNNRRLWAYKDYAKHLRDDVQVRVRLTSLFDGVRLRDGRPVIPKFFEANSSPNDGEDVEFIGSRQPMCCAPAPPLQESMTPGVAPSEADAHHAKSWESLLDGHWLDGDGEVAALVSGTCLTMLPRGETGRIEVQGALWPIACQVEGYDEVWEGAIVRDGQGIFWSSGHKWHREDTTLAAETQDCESLVLEFQFTCEVQRAFIEEATKLLELMQEKLGLKSNADFSSRLVPRAKSVVVAFADKEYADAAHALSEEHFGGVEVRTGWSELSSHAEEKAEGLRPFLANLK